MKPAPTATTQGGLLAVVEQGSHLRQGYVGLGQVALGQIAVGFVLDRFEGGAFFADPPLHGPRVHIESPGDLPVTARAGAQ